MVYKGSNEGGGGTRLLLLRIDEGGSAARVQAHCPLAHLPTRIVKMDLFYLAGAGGCYRGTSLIRNRHPVGPYRRTM